MLISYKSLGAQMQMDDIFLSLASSLGFIINAFTRLLLGALQDKVCFKRIFIFIILLEVFSCFTIMIFASSKLGFLIYMGLGNIIHGGIIVTTTALYG
jgi:hypothetical protein